VNITKQFFGTTPETGDAHLYTLTNNHGIEVAITNYGGAIKSIKVPDRNGNLADIVLGYDTLAEYVRNPRYFGCLVGRHANRIGLGKFSINGTQYQLVQNNGVNHLHGGPKGFDKKVWTASDELIAGSAVLHLNYLSAAGEENYPGNLNVNVNYILSDDNELRLEYRATTDQTTIVNLTNHSYFNLAAAGNILAHELTLAADYFTPVSKELIPTGEIRPVEHTPMDFRSSTAVGARIKSDYEQLGFTGGYDHNFVVNNDVGELRLAACLHDPTSGRVMEVLTTQPGIQFYSGNFLDGSLVGKGEVVYHKYAGLCLETQHFPDAPNHPNFPSTLLRPGEEFLQTTGYRFSVE
jgi:aldose 1-epimerase